MAMAIRIAQRSLWALAERQHGVVTRAQLLDYGLGSQAIQHRIVNGRLHPVQMGVYALGRPQLTQYGSWMAAVLSCGPGAVLSHHSAAALWGIRPGRGGKVEASVEAQGTIEVSVGAELRRSRPGVVAHRRARLDAADLDRHHGIPVTSPACTLIDLAAGLRPDQVEAAVNEADKLGLTDPEALRSAIDLAPRRPGLALLRRVLDRRTFLLTDSELERHFLPLARRAGLARPQTGWLVNGYRVDFYWPRLGLIVETDGLRYHRTPAQQTRDRERDQAHAAAGLAVLRFTHAQVRFEPRHVVSTLSAVARRLRAASQHS